MSRAQRALRSTLVVSGFGYAAQVLSLLAIPVFLGTVGTEAYGLMVTVLAFMGYLGFADAGLNWGAMILMGQAHGRGDRAEIAHIVRHSAVLALASGVVVITALAAILFAAAHGWPLPMFAGQPLAGPLLLIAGVQLALNIQICVFYNLFHGLQESYWPGLYQGLGRLLGLIGSLWAAWQTHSILAVLGVQMGLSIATGLVTVWHAWRRHRWAFAAGSFTDMDQYRAQIRIGAKNFLLQVGRVLGGTAPTMAISSVLGPAAVPFYTVSLSLVSLVFMPINSWSAIMQTAYGEAWTSGAKDWVRNSFRHFLEMMLVLGGLGVALFLAMGDTFVRFWTQGRLWVDSGTAVSVSVVVLLGAWLSAGQFLLTGLNRHRQAALAELGNGVLALGCVTLAVRAFGASGVGTGMLVAALVTSAWVLRRQISALLGPDCFPDLAFVFRAGTAAAVSAGAAILAVKAGARDQVAAVPQLALAGTAGLAVFALCVRLFRLVAFADIRTLFGPLKPNFRHP